MAADSVQVGKVDNCCEKCTESSWSRENELADTLNLTEMVQTWPCNVCWERPGAPCAPGDLSGTSPWIEAWETIIKLAYPDIFQVVFLLSNFDVVKLSFTRNMGR